MKRCSLLKEVSATGVRLTRQRRVLIETLQAADRHVDAATLLGLARKEIHASIGPPYIEPSNY